jgi:hypothetical protein
VSEVSWVEEYAIKDDGVTFTAVVKNVGDAATEGGFRCDFLIGGELVTWATASDSLAPGAETTLVADDGHDGNAQWEPAEGGDFVVLAWVNPPETAGHAALVDESDEHNNMQTTYGFVRISPPPPTATRKPPRTPAPTATDTPEASPTPEPTQISVTATDAMVTSETNNSIPNWVWIGSIGLLVAGAIAALIIKRQSS